MPLQTHAPARALFFLHIPKTGGTSIRTWLSNRFASEKVGWIAHQFDSMAERPLILDDCDLVGGHACFAFTARFPQPPHVITFLREPIDRTISQYYFFRQVGKDQLLEEGVDRGLLQVCDLSLADFIVRQPRLARMHLGNAQTWMLSQERLSSFTCGSLTLTRTDLEQAKTNLARCVFVGLTERMKDSIEMLCRTMHWPAGDPIACKNRTEHRPRLEDLDARTLKLLHNLTTLDQELYHFGTGLFEQRLAEMSRYEWDWSERTGSLLSPA